MCCPFLWLSWKFFDFVVLLLCVYDDMLLMPQHDMKCQICWICSGGTPRKQYMARSSSVNSEVNCKIFFSKLIFYCNPKLQDLQYEICSKDLIETHLLKSGGIFFCNFRKLPSFATARICYWIADSSFKSQDVFCFELLSNFFSLNRWLCGIFALAHSGDLSSPPSQFFLLFIIPVVDIVSKVENDIEETMGNSLATAFSQFGKWHCLVTALSVY